MAYKFVRKDTYICDSPEDLKLIPETDMGSSCYVINTATEYRLTSTGEWVKQIPIGSSGGSDGDLSKYITVEQLTKYVQALSNEEIKNIIAEKY